MSDEIRWCPCGTETIVAKGLGSKCYRKQPGVMAKNRARANAYLYRPDVRAKLLDARIVQLQAKLAKLQQERGA